MRKMKVVGGETEFRRAVQKEANTGYSLTARKFHR